MKYSFRYFQLLLSIFLVSFSQFVVVSSALAKGRIKINLKNEIKNGNLLIGLKQYLGNDNKYPKNNDLLNFKTKNNLLRVIDSNGVEHKSKEVSILFKSVPKEKPLILKRFVSGPFASFESAKRKSKLLEKEGYDLIIVNPDDWEIWLKNESEDLSKNNFVLQKKIIRNNTIPVLQSEYISRTLSGPIMITSPENIKINNQLYGKILYLIKDSYGTWTLIEKISFPNYLKGVLPHEMGPNSPLEALKAQAVIARTWAVFNSDRFQADNYHLCVTTQCQVYKPYKVSNQNIEKAIRDTSYQILSFKNLPINAFYHASNGGISAQAYESWMIEDYPYFISKSDLKKISSNTANFSMQNRNVLINFFNDDSEKFYGNDHKLFRWERKVSDEMINNMLLKTKLFDKDNNVLDFKVKDRGVSGRVINLEIKIAGKRQVINLRRDEIRRNLKFLPSNLFIINKLNDNLWLFRGGGFGHGVGLSQSGAIDMAKSGFKYEKILNHYYTGTKLINFKNLMDE